MKNFFLAIFVMMNCLSTQAYAEPNPPLCELIALAPTLPILIPRPSIMDPSQLRVGDVLNYEGQYWLVSHRNPEMESLAVTRLRLSPEDANWGMIYIPSDPSTTISFATKIPDAAVVGVLSVPIKYDSIPSGEFHGDFFGGYRVKDLRALSNIDTITFNNPQVQPGDVISSPDFAFAVYNYDSDARSIIPGSLEMDSHSFSRTSVHEGKVVDKAIMHFGSASNGVALDRTAYDPSRGTAQFVVLAKKGISGGQIGHHRADRISDTTLYFAARLDANGALAVPNEIVSFSQSHNYSHMIRGGVVIHGHVKLK